MISLTHCINEGVRVKRNRDMEYVSVYLIFSYMYNDWQSDVAGQEMKNGWASRKEQCIHPFFNAINK